jgi:hypothetical protein
MGFLSSSKSEPSSVPHPSLELHLEHLKDTVIKPGDTVSGHVQLSTTTTINPIAVEVAFWGQSQTWIRKESSSSTSSFTDYYHYRDLAPLFTVTRNVLPQSKEAAHIPGQAYTMPFTFAMPTGTALNRAHCYQHPEDGVWTVSPHALPPTMFHHGRWGPESPNNCSISYGVTARLICPEFAIDEVVCTLPVLFAPLNPYAHIQNPNRIRNSKTFILSSSTLAGQAVSSVGFRQSLKNKFSSDAPKLDFELAVELPDLLRSGSEFSFRTTFVALSKTENMTRIPEMTFRVLKLELLDFTHFRAPRDWKANNFRSGAPSEYRNGTPRSYRAGDENDHSEMKTLLNSLPDSSTVGLPEVIVEKEKEQGSEYEVWFKGRVPGLTPPSFQSFAITRAYRIKVKIGIEIGGKKFDFTTETPSVRVGSA